MNAVILINKDKGKTSRDVVNSLTNVFNTKRIGHTGTLDPIAQGVLVICINKYTKLVSFFLINFIKMSMNSVNANRLNIIFSSIVFSYTIYFQTLFYNFRWHFELSS